MMCAERGMRLLWPRRWRAEMSMRGCCQPLPGGLDDGVISIVGVRARGRHGVFEHERRDGQDFIADVSVRPVAGLLQRAAASDSIEEALDYSHLADVLRRHIEGEPCNLIEALASRVCDALLADPRIEHACVTIHKPQAPMGVEFADVMVTICRGRT